MEATDSEWEKPLDEGYWEVVLHEGEYSEATSPPLEVEEVLRELRTGLTQPEGQVPNLQSDPDTTGHSESADASEKDPLERDWQWIQESLANGEVIDGKVTGCNRGGLLVELNHLQGLRWLLFLGR